MVKRSAFWCIYLIALIVLFEGALAGFFYFSSGHWIYTREAAAGSIPEALQLPGAVFQPYTGYSLRRGRSGSYLGQGDWVANNFGFQTIVGNDEEICCEYPYVPGDDEYIVGIFGGSVGGGFSLQAQADGSFAKELQAVPDIAGKKVVILNFALPGFRQPQQLTTLAYFLSIGQHFDLVLNIDGFNEVVTSWKNWSDGAEPSFPADSLWGAWGRQLEQQTVPAEQSGYHLAKYHRLAVTGSQESADACSFAACYYWYVVQGKFHAWRVSAETASLPKEFEQRSLFPTKIVSPFPDDFDVYTYTADVWLRSSKGMSELAKAANARYIHILQPNQWFTEAGPYTPIKGDHIYQWVIEPVNQGYRRMRDRIGALEAAEVLFLDSSLLFKGVPERTVYVDDCCHYTQAGYWAIYKATAEALKSAESSSP